MEHQLQQACGLHILPDCIAELTKKAQPFCIIKVNQPDNSHFQGAISVEDYYVNYLSRGRQCGGLLGERSKPHTRVFNRDFA